jgi:4'-phosphopantetheinyl transferase
MNVAGAPARTPVALPAPAPGVDVWMCELSRPADEIARLARLLSLAEATRAGRFGLPSLRDRYIVGRAMLRTLLGARLRIAPERVDIARGKRGRPFAPQADGLDFNVSHTGGMALFGITEHQRIGVDIELRDRKLNVEGVARKFMTARERSALAAEEADSRRRMLLRLWTCKEAMSKATGDALSAPFRRIDVDTGPPMGIITGPPPYVPADWRLLAAGAPAEYLATVALWRGA